MNERVRKAKLSAKSDLDDRLRSAGFGRTCFRPHFVENAVCQFARICTIVYRKRYLLEWTVMIFLDVASIDIILVVDVDEENPA